MVDKIRIKVFSIVGDPVCIDSDAGNKVFKLIVQALNLKRKIILSFQNVEIITPSFLNAAVGQLYRDYPEDEIKSSLSVEYMLPEDKLLLRKVTHTAKLFYKNETKM